MGGVAEITDSFAFQGVKWHGKETDDADIFNQIARDLDLDSVIRRMWQETHAISQYVAVSVWGWKTYHVRGRTSKGNRRKKTYRIWCPVMIRIIDSQKVVPVGHGPLVSDLLAWQATRDELDHFGRVRRGEAIDQLMDAMFLGDHTPA